MGGTGKFETIHNIGNVNSFRHDILLGIYKDISSIFLSISWNLKNPTFSICYNVQLKCNLYLLT